MKYLIILNNEKKKKILKKLRISNCPWALESIHTSSQDNFPLSEVLFCFVLFLTLKLVKLKKSFDILSHLIFEVDRPHVSPRMLQSGKSRAGEFKRLAQGNFANICRDLVPRLVSYIVQGSFCYSCLGTAFWRCRDLWWGFWKSGFWLYWKLPVWLWTRHCNLSGPLFLPWSSERLDCVFSEALLVLWQTT